MDEEQLVWLARNVYVIKNLSVPGSPGWQLVFMAHTQCEPFYWDGTLPEVVAEAIIRLSAKWPLVTG